MIAAGGCSGVEDGPPDDTVDPDRSQPPPDDSDPQSAVWTAAFDATGVGVLSAVWGSSRDDVFVVGGTPSQGEIYHFDGAVWQAMRVPEAPLAVPLAVPLLVWVFGFGPDDVTAVGVGGLNAVTMVGPNEAVVGGLDGFAGSYNLQTGTLTSETADTTLTLHGFWNDGVGRTYGVGGQFFTPYSGLALVRTLGDPGIVPVPPLEAPPEEQPAPQPPCVEDDDCLDGEICDQGTCLPESACEDTDGVCDSDDPCPLDNPDDTDGEGVCDSLDPCPLDALDDSDGDGVCDSEDVCAFGDDSVDSDGNGVPDGCCDSETDCELGDTCGAQRGDEDGFCVPATGPDLEIGVGGGDFACIDGPYTKLAHGGELALCEGFQGIVEMWVSLRLTGLAPNANVEVTRRVSLAEHPCTGDGDCDANLDCIEGYCTPFGTGPTLLPLTDAGDGVNELFGFLYMIFLSADYLDEQEIILTMSVADQADPSITASLDLNAIVTIDRFCLGDEYCPAGQICVDDYCE